jgi:hypothetical protein
VIIYHESRHEAAAKGRKLPKDGALPENVSAEEYVFEAYLTPDDQLTAIAPHLLGGERVEDLRLLEPCAGDGVICALARQWGLLREHITAVEVRQEPAVALDALASEVYIADYPTWAAEALAEGLQYDLIWTNPPFSRLEDFIEASLPLLTPGTGRLALLLRSSFTEAEKRTALLTSHYFHEYKLNWRSSYLKNGSSNTDRWAYSWCVWTAGYPGIGTWEILGKPGRPLKARP